MAIIGTHMLFYSSEAEALSSMLSKAFGFESVDAGGGWLIFAQHQRNWPCIRAKVPLSSQECATRISFMCDDIHATIADLRAKGVQIDGEPEDRRYGIIVTMTLPGGVKVALYQPRHATALALSPNAKP